jgi:hypothetical protein
MAAVCNTFVSATAGLVEAVTPLRAVGLGCALEWQIWLL